MSCAAVVSLSFHFFYVMMHPPSSTLFPYTTLFRSLHFIRRGVAGNERRHFALKGENEGARDGENVVADQQELLAGAVDREDRKSTRLNSSHLGISYAVFCLKKKRL